VAPENIHIYPKEGYWKFQGGRGVSKANIIKGKYEPKLEFRKEWGGGGGLNQKILCGRGMDIFWNNTLRVCFNSSYQVAN